MIKGSLTTVGEPWVLKVKFLSTKGGRGDLCSILTASLLKHISVQIQSRQRKYTTEFICDKHNWVNHKGYLVVQTKGLFDLLQWGWDKSPLPPYFERNLTSDPRLSNSHKQAFITGMRPKKRSSNWWQKCSFSA